MVNQRVWWCAGAVAVGVNAALLTGSGVAAADGGDAGSTQRTSQHDKPTTRDTSTDTPTSSRDTTATKRHTRPKPALATRQQADDPADSAEKTTDSPKTARRQQSSLPKLLSRTVTSLDSDHRTKAAEPVTAEPAAPAVTAARAAATDRGPLATSRPIVDQFVAAVREIAQPRAIGSPAPPPLAPGRVAALVINALSGLRLSPRPLAVGPFSTLATWADTLASEKPVVGPTPANGVTGVKVGHADLTIPVDDGYDAPADWYFPTQADGTVQPDGVIWLQHGFLLNKSVYSALATTLAQQTNSVVVAPTITSNPLACGGDCALNSPAMRRAAASMFLGDRAALNASAAKAGYEGTLPGQFVLAGHSAGGGFATEVAGYTVENGAAGNLLGVVMFDGVASMDTFDDSMTSLDSKDIPVYQIGAPAQSWNANAATTDALIAARPDQFVGVELVDGSHVDSQIGNHPLIDIFLQLVTKFSPPGNTQAVYTLSTGWIDDMYVAAGPDDPQHGLYGQPGDRILIGEATAIVLPRSSAAL